MVEDETTGFNNPEQRLTTALQTTLKMRSKDVAFVQCDDVFNCIPGGA